MSGTEVPRLFLVRPVGLLLTIKSAFASNTPRVLNDTPKVLDDTPKVLNDTPRVMNI